MMEKCNRKYFIHQKEKLYLLARSLKYSNCDQIRGKNYISVHALAKQLNTFFFYMKIFGWQIIIFMCCPFFNKCGTVCTYVWTLNEVARLLFLLILFNILIFDRVLTPSNVSNNFWGVLVWYWFELKTKIAMVKLYYFYSLISIDSFLYLIF